MSNNKEGANFDVFGGDAINQLSGEASIVNDLPTAKPPDIQWENQNAIDLVSPRGGYIRYRLPAAVGNEHRITLNFHYGPDFKTELNLVDNAWRPANQWNTQNWSYDIEGPVRIWGVWDYYGNYSYWSYKQVYLRVPAAFDAPVVTTGTVSGTARKGSLIKLMRSGAVLSNTVTVGESGRWTVTLLASVAQGSQAFAIREDVTGTLGRYTETKTLTVLKAPTISEPIANPPTASPKPLIAGANAVSGATVDVYIKGTNTKVLAAARVLDNGTWSGTSTHAFGEGRHTLVAHQVHTGVTSDGGERVFHRVGPPLIKSPVKDTFVETNPTIVGTVPGAQYNPHVDIYLDGVTAPLASVAPDYATGDWSKAITLTPGPVAITATQTYLSTKSERAPPVALKVRPAPPIMAFRAKGEGIELHGTGFNGAVVDIHFKNNSTVAYTATVTQQVWAKDVPSDVVPGSKTFSCKQSVSDGGSGRIYNTGWGNDVTAIIPTPVPTGVTRALDGQTVTFSGKGRQWAAANVVVVIFNNNVDMRPAVPAATVQASLDWATPGNVLPPGNYDKLTARQWVNNTWSADSAPIPTLTVPSPPPVFTKPEPGMITGQRPQIQGTVWAGSSVTVTAPGRDSMTVTASGTIFTISATEDWAPATYNLTAIATFGGQSSVAATRSFTVKTPPPIITTPDNAEVDLVPVIDGTGYKGCWVIIYSNVTNQELGAAEVDPSGKWVATLTSQSPAALTIYAIQQEGRNSANVSDRSALKTIKVRVIAPVISVPGANGRPARTSTFSGTAAVGGTVELRIKGQPQPFETNIAVRQDGTWTATVTRPLGTVTIEALLRQGTFLSAPFERTVTVVPGVPDFDSPRSEAALGEPLVISGFGFPGDRIRIDRRNHYKHLAFADVSPQGTWSTSVEHGMLEGDGIGILAHAENLDSAYTATRNFLLLGAAPRITEPLADDWVGVRPLYSGLAAPGASITVASWFNVEDVLAPTTNADGYGRWAVRGNKDLPEGPMRVTVRQTANGTPSTWGGSRRFMVERKSADFEAPSVNFPLPDQEVGRRPMFSGTGEPGAEILIVKDGSMNTVLDQTFVDRDGHWALQCQIELPVSATPYVCWVRQRRDGVDSRWSLPHRSFIVVQVPDLFEQPIIRLPVGNPEQILEERPLFAGTGLPGAQVNVVANEGSLIYASALVDAEGQWSARAEYNANGPGHAVRARQNRDGQYSAWSDSIVRYMVAKKLDKPTVTSPASGDFVSRNPVIRGTAAPGAQINIYRSGNPWIVWGQGIADEQGQWIVVLAELPGTQFSMAGQAAQGTLRSPWMDEVVLNLLDIG